MCPYVRSSRPGLRYSKCKKLHYINPLKKHILFFGLYAKEMPLEMCGGVRMLCVCKAMYMVIYGQAAIVQTIYFVRR